jgi:hypothetical protein
VIIVVAVLLALVLWAVDRGLTWTMARSPQTAAEPVVDPTAD